MAAPRTLVVYPSPAGRELAAAVHALAARHGFEVGVFGEEWTRDDFFYGAFASSAIVLDASIEEAGDAVYRRAIVLPSFLDHMLVVSRTPLPLNYVPVRGGGAPPYPYPRTELAGRPRYEWSNAQILEWLDHQLADPSLVAGPRLEEHDFRQLNELRQDAPKYRAMLETSMQRRAQRKSRRVFVSYRGSDYDGVRRFVAQHRDREFHVVAPGELALDRELLTSARRWMLLGAIEDAIRQSSEVWVYRTPRYHGSWWTLGELVSVALIDEPPARRSPPIRVFDAGRGTFVDDLSFRIPLTAADRKRLARRLTNTRLDTGGLEKVESVRRLREVINGPLAELIAQFGESFIKLPQMEMLFGLLPPEAKADDLRADVREFVRDPAALRRYASDPIFSDTFWNDLRLDPAYVTGVESPYPLDAEALITRSEEMIAFDADEVATAAATGHPAWSKDRRAQVRVVEGPPRYLWSAPTSDNPDPGLRTLRVYLAGGNGAAPDEVAPEPR